MKILKFENYSFIKDNFEYLKEDSEFNQYQFGIEPHGLGPGYGFAVDPQISLNAQGDSPYADNYARTSQMVNDLSRVVRNIQGDIVTTLKRNFFVEDVDSYSDFTILRIYINTNMKVDVYISFDFKGKEFFGVFKNFNGLDRPPLFKSDLFIDMEHCYIDREYYLKLASYLYKIYYNWFVPIQGNYINMKDGVILKGEMGEHITLKENTIIQVVGYNVDEGNDPYLVIKYKDQAYNLTKNDFYFFKYWFEPT